MTWTAFAILAMFSLTNLDNLMPGLQNLWRAVRRFLLFGCWSHCCCDVCDFCDKMCIFVWFVSVPLGYDQSTSSFSIKKKIICQSWIVQEPFFSIHLLFSLNTRWPYFLGHHWNLHLVSAIFKSSYKSSYKIHEAAPTVVCHIHRHLSFYIRCI